MTRLAVVALLCAVAAPSTAQAGRRDRPLSGQVLFVRDGGIHRVDPAAKTEPVRLVDLPDDSADDLRDMQASSAGDVLLLDLAGRWHWVVLPAADDAPVKPRPLDCHRQARLSPDGDWVLCAGAPDVTVVYRLRPVIRKIARLLPPDQVHFHGSGGRAIVAQQGESVWAIPLHAGGGPERLSPHHPVAHLLPAPDGERAVGAYEEQTDRDGAPLRVLYTFRLNGQSVKRRLIPGVPLIWSRDSRWLLVQNRRRACIVRGVGGEFKCWNRFEAVALAPDGQHALFARKARRGEEYVLYRAELAGAHPKRPRRVLRNVGRHALWVPGPES